MSLDLPRSPRSLRSVELFGAPANRRSRIGLRTECLLLASGGAAFGGACGREGNARAER